MKLILERAIRGMKKQTLILVVRGVETANPNYFSSWRGAKRRGHPEKTTSHQAAIGIRDDEKRSEYNMRIPDEKTDFPGWPHSLALLLKWC